MYHKIAVKIPVIKGKIIIKKKRESTYVLYQYGRKYNIEKHYAVPQRVIVGKVHETDESLMYPNEKFQEYFPEEVLPEELSESSRSCALKIGSYAIIQKILEDYKLPDIVKRRFGDDSGLLLDLVSYLLVDEENAGQYYPDFAFNHPLFSENMRIFSDSKVCRLLQSITKEQIIGFMDDWNKKRDHKQRIYISYDSTNKNCQAGDIDIAEYGKSKDDKGLPVFNLAIAYDKTNRVPLFYEEYPGSINDVSQFEYMVNKVKEYKYKSIGFILDRGYFSKNNIRYMEENGYSFIMMVKGCKKLVSNLITEYRNTFETDRECSIRSYRVYGKTILSKLYEDDRKDRYFHLYFNPSLQSAEREQFEQNIDRMSIALEKYVGQQISFSPVYHEFFSLRYNDNGVLVSFSENKKAIQNRLEHCGYFCIITSEAMTAAQALIQYKGRDISEKLFSADKTFIGSKSARVHSSGSLSARLFIEFVALIVRNRIYNLLKETLLRLDAKPNYMSVPAAIRELEKIEMVRRNNGDYKLDHAISKKQKVILSAFGIDDMYIREIASKISKLLADNKSMLDVEAEEEDDCGAYENDCFD